MDTVEFWNLIEASARHSRDPDERADWLTDELAGRSAPEIVGFEEVLDELSSVAMTWQMWAAADRLKNGCSDDGFTDFRAWLVGLGRDTFQAVVAEPDALAEVPEVMRLAGRDRRDWTEAEWPSWESLEGVASQAYQRQTGVGQEDFEDLVREYEGDVLTDEEWDFEDAHEAARRLPRLTEMFPRGER